MRVLVAIDGSNDAKAAVQWVAHLPLPADRTVMAFTSVPAPAGLVERDKRAAIRAALIADARRLVDGAASELLHEHGVTIGRVVEGDPREEIVTAARNWGADLVVVGARGLGALSRLFLGSVSLAVARQAPCPVLVGRGSPRDVHAVTVALDGSAHAQRALEWLTTSFDLSLGLRLRFLGVARPAHYPATAPGLFGTTLGAEMAAVEAQARAVLEGQLVAAAKALRARISAIETEVLTGAPADVILRDVEQRGTDLLVVGARGAGAASRMLVGSVSEAVLHQAVCPVLIVRPPDAG